MNTKYIYTTALLTLSLSACNTNMVCPTNTESVMETGPTELISKTMSQVKAGAAVLEKFFIAKKATIKNTEVLDQYVINFAPPFNKLDDYISLFKNHCESLQGDYRNAICWNHERTKINFIAETFITKYDPPINKIFVNVIEPKTNTNMELFTDNVASLVSDMPVIKFKSNELTRFNKLQKLEVLYDDLAPQIQSLNGFNNVSNSELLSAAKTIHDSLSVSGKIKKVQIWHTSAEVIGTVTVLKKYQDGNQNCADIKVFRKEGITPSFIGDMNKIISGNNGNDLNINTLCTDMNDKNGFNWHFVS